MAWYPAVRGILNICNPGPTSSRILFYLKHKIILHLNLVSFIRISNISLVLILIVLYCSYRYIVSLFSVRLGMIEELAIYSCLTGLTEWRADTSAALKTTHSHHGPTVIQFLNLHPASTFSYLSSPLQRWEDRGSKGNDGCWLLGSGKLRCHPFKK